jgi:hypothetical protein
MTYLQLLDAIEEAKRWNDEYEDARMISNNSNALPYERSAAEQRMHTMRTLLSQEIVS